MPRAQPKYNKLYYGWYIAAIAFLANFMSVGTGFYAFNAFMEPLCQLRHWSRTDLNMAMVIGTLFGFMGQFVYGTLVIRIGVRPLMMAGAMAGGTAFIFMARVEQLWQFYLFYTLLFIGNGAYGGIVAATSVNNWFVRKRGKALGLATAGISFSGAVVPLLAMFFILKEGITAAALYLGLAVMLVSPLAWRVIREWPEDIGLLPDGLPAPAPDDQSPPVGARSRSRPARGLWTPGALVRIGAFWKIGFAFAMLMTGTVGVMSQLKPRFSDIGFNDIHAMLLMAGTALVGAYGKYQWGALCDRFKPINVSVALALANACGLSLALFHGSMITVFLFIVIFGFTMGGILATIPVMVAYLFGREHFASVLRYISLFLILQLSGYLVAGRSYDLTGSYDTAYLVFIALDIAAAALLATVRRPRPPH